MAPPQTMALNLSDPPAGIRTMSKNTSHNPVHPGRGGSFYVYLEQTNENQILKIEAIFASLFFAKDFSEMKGGSFLSLFCLHLRR